MLDHQNTGPKIEFRLCFNLIQLSVLLSSLNVSILGMGKAVIIYRVVCFGQVVCLHRPVELSVTQDLECECISFYHHFL